MELERGRSRRPPGCVPLKVRNRLQAGGSSRCASAPDVCTVVRQTHGHPESINAIERQPDTSDAAARIRIDRTLELDCLVERPEASQSCRTTLSRPHFILHTAPTGCALRVATPSDDSELTVTPAACRNDPDALHQYLRFYLRVTLGLRLFETARPDKPDLFHNVVARNAVIQ